MIRNETTQGKKKRNTRERKIKAVCRKAVGNEMVFSLYHFGYVFFLSFYFIISISCNAKHFIYFLEDNIKYRITILLSKEQRMRLKFLTGKVITKTHTTIKKKKKWARKKNRMNENCEFVDFIWLLCVFCTKEEFYLFQFLSFVILKKKISSIAHSRFIFCWLGPISYNSIHIPYG